MIWIMSAHLALAARFGCEVLHATVRPGALFRGALTSPAWSDSSQQPVHGTLDRYDRRAINGIGLCAGNAAFQVDLSGGCADSIYRRDVIFRRARGIAFLIKQLRSLEATHQAVQGSTP
jgi:hypothetical protein